MSPLTISCAITLRPGRRTVSVSLHVIVVTCSLTHPDLSWHALICTGVRAMLRFTRRCRSHTAGQASSDLHAAVDETGAIVAADG